MKNLIKALTLAGAITLGCDPEKTGEKPLPDSQDKKTPAVTPVAAEVKRQVDTCILYDPTETTPEEKELEALRQKSFYEEYAKSYPDLFGKKLYTNPELLCPTFEPNGGMLPSWVRLMQYFLRNGKEKTFEAAQKLGCKYHATVLDENHVLSRLFADAGIDITGETIGWIEIPDAISGSGGLWRDGKKYGGNDEIIMKVTSGSYSLDDSWVMAPAKKAGYNVDPQKEFEGTVANEMSHEIQYKYFPTLFDGYDEERLDEPFKSFKTEIPGLRFRNNAQAAEFLSDVANWSAGGKNGVYYRFFNPLYYMSAKTKCGKGKVDTYRYSFRVQKYAMEKVLSKKGFKDAKKRVNELIRIADREESLKNHDNLFISARRYFTEDDFAEIAEIYRRIGVSLLKKMTPYYGQK